MVDHPESSAVQYYGLAVADDQTLHLDDSLSTVRYRDIGDDAPVLSTLDSDAPPLSYDLRKLEPFGAFGQQRGTDFLRRPEPDSRSD